VRRRADPDEEDEDGGNDLVSLHPRQRQVLTAKFGDSDNEAPRRDARSPSTQPSTPGSTRRLEYPEEEEVETSEVIADVPVPTWPRLTATDGKVWHVKLPAYVNVEARPFDPEYYRATKDDTEELTGPAAKGKMIGVRNTVRWRWKDGERQSNARMLRWSDGSVSLQLGSDLFDLAPSYGATLARPQDESAKKEEVVSGGRETTFLCVTAPNEQVLVTETAIAGQLSLVPTSMDSKTHRELVMHVGAQQEKQSRMMILDDVADQGKLAELLARAAPQRPTAVKPSASRSRVGQRSLADSLGGRRGERFKREASGESDFDDRDRRRARDRDYDEDDGFVVADSDDEDGYGSRPKKKSKKSKRRSHDYDDTEDEDEDEDQDLDETELADRLIEQAERERERKRGGSSKKEKKRSKEYVTSEEEEDAEGEDDAEMDVESEEE